MNNLHPGARWLFRIRSYVFLIPFGIFLTFWAFPLYNIFARGVIGSAFNIAIIFYILFVILIAEIYSRMSYNRFLYEITNEGVKIEQGIIWKKYTSIPFERVQNVDIQRGVIARLLRFSTLQIETAGQSGFSGGYRSRRRGRGPYRSEGYLPAIDFNESEQIRSFIMKKIKHSADSGI